MSCIYFDHPGYSNTLSALDVLARLKVESNGRFDIVFVDPETHTLCVADIKPFIDDFKIQMATPAKNKPYYRQFEKRGKW